MSIELGDKGNSTGLRTCPQKPQESTFPSCLAAKIFWVLYWDVEHIYDYLNSSLNPKYFLHNDQLKIAFQFQVAYILFTESLYQVKDEQTN